MISIVLGKVSLKKKRKCEPLKSVRDDDDVSMAMKLEIFPNRDSTVFMDRFGMQECETFIRGTYRFKGFSPVSTPTMELILVSKSDSSFI